VHVRACFAALTLCACGRIGFEQPPRHGDAAIDDAAPVAGFIVSQTLLSSFVGFTWVAVDVDWSRRLAYLATRETGRCVAVVDFTDELHPQIIQRIDGGRTTCLGVALDGNASRLVVLSYGAGQVALFDLGADPRAGTYASLDVATVPGPRHFAIDRGVSPSRVYVVSQSPALTALTLTDSTLVPVPGGTWAGTCAQPSQAVTAFGAGATRRVAVGCQADHSPVEVLDDTLAVIGTIPNDSAVPGNSGFWSAATLPDGRALVLGWLGTLIAADGSVLARWDNIGGYRDAVIVGADVAWTAKDDGSIEVLSIGATGLPRVIGASRLGVAGEAYGIRIAPDATRGIAVTNRGYLVVFDPRAVEPADFAWPAN
jgi:hypothetical protein